MIITEIKQLQLMCEEVKTVKEGEEIFTPPLLWHATYHHKPTEMLVVSKNFRDRKTYEKNTVRVNFVTKDNVKKILK